MNACGTCDNLSRERESWELQHIQWWECRARPGLANLSSFPFRQTKCGAWTPIRTRTALADPQEPKSP